MPTRLFGDTVAGLSHPSHTLHEPTVASLKTKNKKKQVANAFLVRPIRTENVSETRRWSYKGNSTLTGVNTIVSGCRDNKVKTIIGVGVNQISTLDSGINVAPGTFGKNIKSSP